MDYQNVTHSPILPSVVAANTAAATSGAVQWLDTMALEGDILVVLNAASVTGSIAGKLQSATSSSGAGAADIPGATFTTLSAAGSAVLAIDANWMPQRFLGFVGTVVTGPVTCGVVAIGRAKSV